MKHGHGSSAAASVHPTVARDLMRAATERAIQQTSTNELEPLVVAPPITVEVDYHRPIEADYAAIVPGAERVGDRGVRYETSDMASAYRAFLAGVRLAGICD